MIQVGMVPIRPNRQLGSELNCTRVVSTCMFMDATSQFYMRQCRSVARLVVWSYLQLIQDVSRGAAWQQGVQLAGGLWPALGLIYL